MTSRLRDSTLPELVDTARSAQHPEHEDAFGEIVRRFRAHAQASAYRLVRDPDLAQDVAQEAFLDAYLGLGSLRDPAAFPGWFRRIVFKHADRIRRRPRLRLAELYVAEGLPVDADGPEALAAAREDAARVRGALESLPGHEQVVVVLFYFAQQSHTEIGERLEIPITTVKKRLHDARRRMQVPLESPGAPRQDERRSDPTPVASAIPVAPVPEAGLDGAAALQLATLGTREARGALCRYAPDQLAGAIQTLPAHDQVAFLEVSERLPEIVPCLPEVTLTQTLRSVGLADAGWLVEFASPEQRVAAFDLDCWRGGHLSPKRLFEWIDALIEAGTETLLAALGDLDQELWILALQQMARFEIPAGGHLHGSGDVFDEENTEFDVPEGLTHDGVVYYEPISSDHEERLREILSTARIYAPSLYWDLVYGAIQEPMRSCEETAARWQRGRLNDLGFPDLEQAMGVYRPLPVESVARIEIPHAPPAQETPVPALLADSSLGQALAALSPERAGEIQNELFYLANAVAVADRLPLGVGAALEHALGKALEGLDRGLVALAAAQHRSLAEIADTHGPRELFRIGATLRPALRPQTTLGQLEAFEQDIDELDWDVPYEWLDEEDQTLDAHGQPQAHREDRSR